MTDDTKKDARKLSPDEYKSAVAELLREARKAEAERDAARVQAAVEAKFAMKDARK